MRVREILSRKGDDVVAIEPQATVHAALRRLNERRIGALVVTRRDGRIAGIISERDILREAARRCDAIAVGMPSLEAIGPVLVHEIMTRDVITASPEDDLTSVMATMTRHRIRHLPIVDNDMLAGIISIGDAVKACVEIAEAENEQLKAYIQGATY